jgi:hypothetical protein
MWCTIINGALLMFSTLLCIFAQGFIYHIHSRWFPMTKETFALVLYSFIGAFKIFVIVFNLVPWISLLIIA